MTLNRWRAPLLMSLALAVLSGGVLFGQNTPAPQGREPAAGRGMMAQRQQMMAEMQAEQKKLGELVAMMNNATGADKVDRIAAVVTELVAQHNRMADHMTAMQSGMMQGMMQGRQTPPSGAAGAEPAPPDDHTQHHP